MISTYKIIWSDESLKNFDSIIEYLEQNWSEKEIGKFLILLYEVKFYIFDRYHTGVFCVLFPSDQFCFARLVRCHTG